jgi:hypothetical protein
VKLQNLMKVHPDVVVYPTAERAFGHVRIRHHVEFLRADIVVDVVELLVLHKERVAADTSGGCGRGTGEGLRRS